MSRIIPVIALLLGWVMLLAGTGPLRAQQIRNMNQKAPAIGGLQNNFNTPQAQQNQKVVGFNVLGAANQNNNQAAAPGGTANAIMNGINNGTLGNPNLNPYNSGFPTGYNPYANNAALSPYNYNTMMYGSPYGPMPINPYYGYYNPYQFLNTGTIAGTSTGVIANYPTPAQMYNFNLNYQYLSNPYLNSLSNPAFSGPFPAGVFNSTAALNILGFGNILQNFPLNPNPAGAGNSTTFP